MTIRLRPHHLLCMLTYAGKGYSPAFTANYDVIAGRIARGEDILIVEGPDDVCAPLLGDDDAHCWRDSVTKRDQLASRDLTLLLARPIQAGQRLALSSTLLSRMRQAFAKNRTREACLGCEWNTLCTAIAAEGYRATRFQVV
jgi:hypothetical protein